MKKIQKSALALFLAIILALQGTEPIFVQAKEMIEDVQINIDFSRPEALTEEEAGIVRQALGEEETAESEHDGEEKESEAAKEQTKEENIFAEETAKEEVELKEPQEYYPLPDEPQGELVDYDAISRTYRTGEQQYTTVYMGRLLWKCRSDSGKSENGRWGQPERTAGIAGKLRSRCQGLYPDGIPQ